MSKRSSVIRMLSLASAALLLRAGFGQSLGIASGWIDGRVFDKRVRP